MAYFAKLKEDNTVDTVVRVENSIMADEDGVEQEQLGIDFLNKTYKKTNVTWVQTSINTRGGKHYEPDIDGNDPNVEDGKTPLRKNYASSGYTYDATRDAFIQPQPFPSWTLDEDTCLWQPPVVRPDDENEYVWNEGTQSWDLV